MNSGDWLQVAAIIVLLALSAFFSSAETALTTVNQLRIRTLAEEGDKRAICLLKIIRDPGKMLSAILIGNNVVNISASSLMTIFVTNLFGSAFVGVSTGILTVLVLIFGEITPKTMATLHAERIALKYARIIAFLTALLTPVIWIVTQMSGFILKLLKVDPNQRGTSYTESELRTIVDVSHEEGVIEQEEQKMIKNVFDFGDVCAKDIMVPRIDMVMAAVDITFDGLMELFAKEHFTRIPVYEAAEGNNTPIIGVVNMKDILLYKQNTPFYIRDYLREPFFTYEYKNISDLLVEMRQTSFNLAIVLDEYGDVAGLVTVEDILEEIVGEIRDEYDAEEEHAIEALSSQEYMVDGSLNLEDINERFQTEFHSDDYDSIAGLIIQQLDRLPDTGDSAVVDGITLTVAAMDKQRISRVKMTFPQEANTEKEDSATD